VFTSSPHTSQKLEVEEINNYTSLRIKIPLKVVSQERKGVEETRKSTLETGGRESYFLFFKLSVC
jgi:hypothetical protein